MLASAVLTTACSQIQTTKQVTLSHGIDQSAGGDPAFIIKTPTATYYLEKQGGGLSSLLDKDGVDWLAFDKTPGSGHKGEYRGFPNAVHKQDGSYFHAMNAGTDPSTAIVELENNNHVRIKVTSGNGQWQAQWNFYPDRCDFLMTKVSPGHQYWVQYEGVPGGKMDDSDFWFSSAIEQKQNIRTHFDGDLPAPEWMAFGDKNSPRMLIMLHHEDDDHPDNYEDRPDMTVFAFGRSQKNKYLNSPQKFSIGFVESTEYKRVSNKIYSLLD
nr:hypothetical protein [Gayadomonas joobiniege]